MKEKSEIIQSPEQIADHLQVTYVPTYLLAAAAALLLAAFIVWGVLGSVSDKAYYSGVVWYRTFHAGASWRQCASGADGSYGLHRRQS